MAGLLFLYSAAIFAISDGMSGKRIYVSTDKTAKELAHLAFPEWRGKKISIAVAEPDQVFGLTTYNGEHYALMNLETNAAREVPYHSSGMPGERPFIKIMPNLAVFRHSMFQSHECGITIYLHPENATLLLPKPAELSWAEQVVLTVSRKYIANFREKVASDETGITPEEYLQAKQSLIDRKLLNRAGAITDAGLNAIGDDTSLWKLERTQPGGNPSARLALG